MSWRYPEEGEPVAVTRVVRLAAISFRLKDGYTVRVHQAILPSEGARLLERALGRVPKRLYFTFAGDGVVAYPEPPPIPAVKGAVICNRYTRGKYSCVKYRVDIPLPVVQRWREALGRLPPYVEVTVTTAGGEPVVIFRPVDVPLV